MFPVWADMRDLSDPELKVISRQNFSKTFMFNVILYFKKQSVSESKSYLMSSKKKSVMMVPHLPLTLTLTITTNIGCRDLYDTM